jgi:hypothetical protein
MVADGDSPFLFDPAWLPLSISIFSSSISDDGGAAGYGGAASVSSKRGGYAISCCANRRFFFFCVFFFCSIFFSSLMSVFFSVLSFLSIFYILHPFPLFFLYISAPFAPLSIGIYRGKRVRELLPLSSYGTEVVGWSGSHWAAARRACHLCIFV